MRQTRIFVDQPLADGGELVLNERAANHVVRVLRMRAGDALTVFNGDGREYPATLVETARQRVRATLGVATAHPQADTPQLVLAQALVSNAKMDLIVQKAVELGVHRIAPVTTQRCTVRLAGARLEKRLTHWREVAISACEQCARVRLPSIDPPRPLQTWCQDTSGQAGLRMMLVPDGGARLAQLAPGAGAITMLVGPEGGLSDDELAALQAAGFTGVRLGPRVMRTETAGLATLAAVQALWGDWRTD